MPVKLIFADLLKFVEEVKENPSLINSSLKSESVESLVLRKKLNSLKLNFIYAYEIIIKFLERNHNYGKDSLVLDACCGLGFFTDQISANLYNVKGFDINESYLRFARENNFTKSLISVPQFFTHDINKPIPSGDYHLISSIFGLSIAYNPLKVVGAFIKHNPKIIILFDSNSNSVYRFLGKRGSGIDFRSIKKLLGEKNYKIVLEKNVHTLPSFMIDMKYFGFFFIYLSMIMRKLSFFSASKLLIATIETEKN